MLIDTKIKFTAVLIPTDKLKDALFVYQAKIALQEIIHAFPNPLARLPVAAEEPKRLTDINIALNFT